MQIERKEFSTAYRASTKPTGFFSTGSVKPTKEEIWAEVQTFVRDLGDRFITISEYVHMESLRGDDQITVWAVFYRDEKPVEGPKPNFA
jgi:hypothetical protein